MALVARLVRAGLEAFIRPGGSCHAFVSVPLRRYTTPSLWIHVTIHDSRTPPQPTLAPLDLVGRSGAVLIRRGLDTYHSMWIGTRRIAASQPGLYRRCMANHPAARRAHPMIRQVSALLMLFAIPHGHVNGLSEVNRAQMLAVGKIRMTDTHVPDRQPTGHETSDKQWKANNQQLTGGGKCVCSSNFLVGPWEKRGARGAENPAEVLRTPGELSFVGCLLPHPGTPITPIMGTTTRPWRQLGVALAGLGLGLDVAAVAPRRGARAWLTARLVSV